MAQLKVSAILLCWDWSGGVCTQSPRLAMDCQQDQQVRHLASEICPIARLTVWCGVSLVVCVSSHQDILDTAHRTRHHAERSGIWVADVHGLEALGFI